MRSPAATGVGGAEIGALSVSREGSAGLGPGATPPRGGGREGGFGGGTIGGAATVRAPGGCGCRIAGGDVVGGATGNGTGGVRAGAGLGSATGSGTGTGDVVAGTVSGGRSLLQNGHRTAMAGICSAQKKQVLVESMVLCQGTTLARSWTTRSWMRELRRLQPRYPFILKSGRTRQTGHPVRTVQRICCARSPTQVKKPRPLPPPAQSIVGAAGMRLALAWPRRGRTRLRDVEGAMIGRLRSRRREAHGQSRHARVFHRPCLPPP